MFFFKYPEYQDWKDGFVNHMELTYEKYSNLCKKLWLHKIKIDKESIKLYDSRTKKIVNLTKNWFINFMSDFTLDD